MKGICVRSEIKPLKKVLLHRPGRELLHLTPDRLPELLFDDIPFLKVAQQEHAVGRLGLDARGKRAHGRRRAVQVGCDEQLHRRFLSSVGPHPKSEQ